MIEADEYDTAFFDKRAKFVHYRPRTLMLNNLEFDHADIYPDLAAIERQFHHLIRTVPGSGRLLVNGAMRTWRACSRSGAGARWSVSRAMAPIGRGFDAAVERGTRRGRGRLEFALRLGEELCGTVRRPLIGLHNVDNALAAIGAARHAGVPPEHACAAL